MKNGNSLWPLVEARRDAFCALADQIRETPETLHGEQRAAAVHRDTLKAQGFRVTEIVAAMQTGDTDAAVAAFTRDIERSFAVLAHRIEEAARHA